MDDYSFATLFDKTFLDKVEANASAVCDNKSIGRTSGEERAMAQTRNYWKSSVKKRGV
ncbi:hypothetical protein KCP71_03060 [Salmonella enterica subsp. enterica]|nr:hypothetical protein KCP71_03060 [Salmonella enterica subsp. enterica]